MAERSWSSGAPAAGDATACHTYTMCVLGAWPGASSARDESRVHEFPVQLDGEVADVLCGADWLCVVTEHGRALLLGGNAGGQLGQSEEGAPSASSCSRSTAARKELAPLLRPLAFPWGPERRIARLSCGPWHGGFVLSSGELFMFGSGAYGQLGTGSRRDCHAPLGISMSWSTLLESGLSAETHHRGKTQDEIPQETTASRVGAAAATDSSVFFTDISCGDRHTLVLARREPLEASAASSGRSHTSVISFGDGLNGRLGLGHERDSLTGALVSTCAVPPSESASAKSEVRVSNSATTGRMPSDIVGISAGAAHNLATTASGLVWSWGSGGDGQLGHGGSESEWRPRQVGFFAAADVHVSAVCCGASHSLALTRAGAVYAWGRGLEGQLGRADGGSATPVRVELPRGSSAQQQRAAAARKIATRSNACLALDENGRLFVWGDNSTGSLGLDRRHRPRVSAPTQLQYMELRSPAASHAELGQSRVAAFRHEVTAASLAMPRERLEHVGASDAFTVLVFKTRSVAALGGSASVLTAELTPRKASQVVDSRPSSVLSGSPSLVNDAAGANAEARATRWRFSLMDTLSPEAIPSRQDVYFKLMAAYKVIVQPYKPRRRPGDLDDGDGDEREELRSLSGGCDVRLTSDRQRLKRAAPKPTLPPPEVKGLDAWLEKRSPSPTTRQQSVYSFGTAARFRSAPSKAIEGRDTSSTDAGGSIIGDAGAVETRSGVWRPLTAARKPETPKSVFGRTLRSSFSVHKSTVEAAVPDRKPPAAPSPPPSQSQTASGPSGSRQQRSLHRPPQAPHVSDGTSTRRFSSADGHCSAAFGSSVASRFGPTWASPSACLGSPLGPDACSLASSRSPGFSMGGSAEHFSLVISKRLAHARGPTPGPGTYDRHGG